ncbi:MAG: type III-A CRISPR-associated RAMP protein Csm3 [Candidatus Methanofastidiosa archaeon]|nr:type III-A CRISPR-associated RAMP protein Csm3 [Candidatus Methanofastidiosa archaeon]
MMDTRPLLGKVVFEGTIYCETGLHIGSGQSTMEIGAIDSSVIRDPMTDEPYIPGSSLKGKIRSLMERHLGKPLVKGKISRHQCSDFNCELCRLFGSSSSDPKGNNVPSRLMFRDAMLTEKGKKNLVKCANYTEIKSENSIDRITSQADKRDIERVPRGAEFLFNIVYDVSDTTQVSEDIQNLLDGIMLLEADYLGGNGSRGYGSVRLTLESATVKKAETYPDGTPVEFAMSSELPSKISMAFRD